MTPVLLANLQTALAAEWLDANRQDQAPVPLGRYLWNMALRESPYPALHFAEIALRNAVHRPLTAPLVANIKANPTESHTLAHMLDTLLPKLLSEELSSNTPR